MFEENLRAAFNASQIGFNWGDDTNKIKQLQAQNKWVVVDETECNCPSTDAIIGYDYELVCSGDTEQEVREKLAKIERENGFLSVSFLLAPDQPIDGCWRTGI